MRERAYSASRVCLGCVQESRVGARLSHVSAWRQRRLFRRLATETARSVTPRVEAELERAKRAVADFRNELRESISLPPICPRCGHVLKVRVVVRGRRSNLAGSEFWGCEAWPSCEYTAPLERHPVHEGAEGMAS
jgi:hypothetical protein